MQEIRQIFAQQNRDVSKMVWQLKEISETAYKLSNKDTPYPDSDTQVRAIQQAMKILWLGKPQQVINMINMRGKSPMN